MLILHDNAYYESRMPQPDLGTFKNFKRFVWNSQRKTFLDRTLESWAQVGLFYLIFFGVIFSLFACKMWITFHYIHSMEKPLVFLTETPDITFDPSNRMLNIPRSSSEGPGLSFKPNILTPMNSPIIWLSQTNKNTQPTKYIESISQFFKGYSDKKSRHTRNCNTASNNSLASNVREPCFFNVSVLGQCSKPPYGYTTGEPCVTIVLNKMLHWIPNYYNATSDLPSAMPDWLKKLIKNSTERNVWLSCSGATPTDREHLGEILYTPTPGFPVTYFPYFDRKHHMSPLVALQFKNISVNRLLTVECTAWARNIKVKKGYSLNFQLMLEKH